MEDELQRLRTLEMQVAHLYRHLGLDPRDAVPVASGALDADVVELINSGQTIHAIKLLRSRTGMGLAEAKDAVEQFESRYRLG